MCDVRNNTLEDVLIIWENKVSKSYTSWVINQAETVHFGFFSDVISTFNLLIQGLYGQFILTLTALTDPKLARQNKLPVFQRHLHSSSARGLCWANAARGPPWTSAGKAGRLAAESDAMISARGLDDCNIIPGLTMAEPAVPGGLQLPVSSQTLRGRLVMHYIGADQGFVVLVNHQLQAWLQLWGCNSWQVAGFPSQAMLRSLMRYSVPVPADCSVMRS